MGRTQGQDRGLSGPAGIAASRAIGLARRIAAWRWRLLPAAIALTLAALARQRGWWTPSAFGVDWPDLARSVLSLVGRELANAGTWLVLLFALDDCLVDGFWLAGVGRGRDDRPMPSGRTPSDDARPIAVLIPVWDEAAVIADMLIDNARALAGRSCELLVGCYANDPATLAAVERAAARALAAGHARIVPLANGRSGPTTKGDNLNAMLAAMVRREAATGQRYAGILCHDAEDQIDPNAPDLFRRWWTVADFVQIPVIPLPDAASRWVAGHYLDEFADAHRRQMPVRCALGAGLPAAGVGCGWTRAAVDRLLARSGGQPFRAASLTEDYETGLASGWWGLACRFVVERAPNGRLVATRAHFPATFRAATVQKSRWIAGIALAGWDRIGWRVPAGAGLARRIAGRWMLCRDRRAPLATAAVLAWVGAVLCWGAASLLDGRPRPLVAAEDAWLLWAGGAAGLWRAGWRMASTGAVHGWRMALFAVPRQLVGHAILVAATLRALGLDRRHRRRGELRWDKTAHRFEAARADPAA